MQQKTESFAELNTDLETKLQQKLKMNQSDLSLKYKQV